MEFTSLQVLICVNVSKILTYAITLKWKAAQLCLTLFDLMDYRVHGIL